MSASSPWAYSGFEVDTREAEDREKWSHRSRENIPRNAPITAVIAPLAEHLLCRLSLLVCRFDSG